MALTKEGLQRAASIMDSILTDLTDPPGLAADLTEDERESLVALQNALDIVQSPLFSALVDIRDKCKKSVEDSERWNEAADVRGTDTADVVVQFKERYNIAGVQNGRQSSVNAIPDHLIDDTTVTSEQSPNGEPSKAVDSSHVPLLSPKSHDECGPTLNAAHHRTPSVSSSDSRGSVGSKRKKGRRQIGGGGVTLGHLARDQSPEGDIPLREFHERGLSASQQQSSDISLSSLSTEASPPPVPTSSPPDIFSDVSASPLSEASADKSEGEHTKDILFFMRDEKSMTDLRSKMADLMYGFKLSSAGSLKQSSFRENPTNILPADYVTVFSGRTDAPEALNGKWGRGHRNVELPHSSLTDSIGVELCGLSTTGVYVAVVRDETLEDRLQIGDQILEVNGHTTENMAWFEVEHLILGANETHKPMVGESTSHNSAKLQLGERGEHRQGSLKLLVQYNPAGMGEVKRLNKTN